MVEESGPVQTRHQRSMSLPNTGLESERNDSTTSIHSNIKETGPRTSALNMFQGLSAPSPTSNYNHSIDMSGIPLALARDMCRKIAYIKARAQYARDQTLDYVSESPRKRSAEETGSLTQQVGCDGFCPTRKQSNFVKEEELQCCLEDRVGTAHISELQTDFEVMPPLSVEEMNMDDEAEGEMVSVDGVRILKDKML